MTPSTLRLIGLAFIAGAAVLMILNLKRVADLGTFWVGLPLFFIGVACVARARRARL
jgi:Na+/phosphate symporter